MSLKIRISSPLEAGQSILDAHHLPASVRPALEYVAGRFARKEMGVTLAVVRREYQVLPAVPATPTFATPPSTPKSPGFAQAAAGAALPFRAGLKSTFKGLVRTRTHPVLPSLERYRALDLQRNFAVSPAFSVSSSTASSSQTPRWGDMSPLSPGSPIPMTPASTFTTASSMAAASSPSTTAFGIRLVYTTTLSPKQDRFVRYVFERAQRKFGLRYVRPLPPPLSHTAGH